MVGNGNFASKRVAKVASADLEGKLGSAGAPDRCQSRLPRPQLQLAADTWETHGPSDGAETANFADPLSNHSRGNGPVCPARPGGRGRRRRCLTWTRLGAAFRWDSGFDCHFSACRTFILASQ